MIWNSEIEFSAALYQNTVHSKRKLLFNVIFTLSSIEVKLSEKGLHRNAVWDNQRPAVAGL